jgi:hypothetical protein
MNSVTNGEAIVPISGGRFIENGMRYVLPLLLVIFGAEHVLPGTPTEATSAAP